MSSILTLFPTHYFYIIAVLFVIALQEKMGVAFSTKLEVIAQLFRDDSVVQNAKVGNMDIFCIQKLAKIT